MLPAQMLFIVFSKFTTDILSVDAVDKVTVTVKQLDSADAVSAVP